MDGAPLLLSSSSILDKYDQYDCIHQSLIDLHYEHSKEEVHELLIKAQECLESRIKIDLANEIFSLILKCYSCFPKDFIPTFVDLFKKMKINSFYPIVITMVLSYLIQNNCSDILSEYNEFILNSLNELIDQIESFDEPQIFVFQHEIQEQFKLNLLLNIAIASNLNEYSEPI